ncbi:metal ABC transporter solute-binding protein, Zn/Mn family [Poseidonibacter sp.]|uniref:metal ABC transporter solute-binding protein, Zn/Mn family n=1 Tax=Poseidonibacter sp. TaxID=2321188 RepID=UPI003C7638E7
MKKIILAVLVIASLSFASKQEVTVSILPQKYFVEKIVGNKLNINVMVKAGFSPTTYEPKTSQMKKLANSKIYFAIDVPFEDVWLEKFRNSNKNMLIVDTAENIDKLEMKEHSHHEEENTQNHKKEESHHEHEGLDPHIWTDPILVKIQAKNILDALIKIDSKNSDFYKSNYKNFIQELDVLNKKLEEILKPVEHKAFMVFHPSWGYFSKRYHLEQVAIETQGKEPKPSELVELIKDAKEHNIKIVFVAPQFSQKSARVIAKSIKGKVVTMDHLAINWDENLIKTAEEIANIYR